MPTKKMATKPKPRKPTKRLRSAASGKLLDAAKAARLPASEVVAEEREHVFWRGWVDTNGAGSAVTDVHGRPILYKQRPSPWGEPVRLVVDAR